jgi:hypothetical protein
VDSRQVCIDVLCAYLRMPYMPHVEPKPTDRNPAEERQVRATALRVIAAHMSSTAPVSWSRHNLELSGVVIDFDVEFRDALFQRKVSFAGAQIIAGQVSFSGAKFRGWVSFRDTRFAEGSVFFDTTSFNGRVSFDRAQFTGAAVSFRYARFSSGSEVSFVGTEFTSGVMAFEGAQFGSRNPAPHLFSGVSFNGAEFVGTQVSFRGADFCGGRVRFGGHVHYVDEGLDYYGSWFVPPVFDRLDPVPAGLELPAGFFPQCPPDLLGWPDESAHP